MPDASNAKADASAASADRCGGTGIWHYDHNHSQPCPDCCTHPEGWWKLSPEHHGATDERYAACYRPACGTTISRAEWDALPEEMRHRV